MEAFQARLVDDIKLRAGGAPTPRSVFRRPQNKRAPSMVVDDSEALYPDVAPMRAATLPAALESTQERSRVPSGSMGPLGAGVTSGGPTTVRSPLSVQQRH